MVKMLKVICSLVFLFVFPNTLKAEGKLNLYNWGDYINLVLI
jgi:spermidine/putrescine-binding protein